MNEIRGLGLDIRLHRPMDVGFEGATPSTLDFGAPIQDAIIGGFGGGDDAAILEEEFITDAVVDETSADDD